MGHIGDNSFRLGQTNSEYYIVWSIEKGKKAYDGWG